MTDQQKREKLLAHPDTITVEFGGESRPWFLGKASIDAAKPHGVRLEDVLDQADEDDLEAGFEQLVRMLWFGFLPFDPDVKQTDFDFLLSFGDIGRLMPRLTATFGEFLGEVQEGKKRSAQGAKDRRKGRS